MNKYGDHGMKNIIIAGVSRAGKSTLAKKIAKKYDMTYIPFDSIVSTLETLYPDIGIAHADENIEMSKKISVFLKEYISHLEYEDINYVLDLYQVYPSDLMKICDGDTHEMIYLGYSSLSASEKLVDIRKYSREKDWTRRTLDEEMLKILNLFISESCRMEQQCKDEGILFFNTGENFEEVQKSAYRYIVNEINNDQK